MTNEELREELWNLESDMARMREHEPKMRRRFFEMIRAIVTRHIDEHESIQWELIEKAVFEPKQSGKLVITACVPDERRKREDS
jgi:hypothetical protein